MSGFLKPFDGFVKEDFETYTEDKWSSNLYNLQRMQVKQKLTALASTLEPALTSWDLDLESELSAERPSIWNQKRVKAQWLYFYRDTKAQKELLTIQDRARSIAENVDDPAHHHRHIVLAVKVDCQGVTIECGLHHNAWLDRKNLQEKWALPHERAKLMALLAALPPSTLVLAAGDRRLPAEKLDESTLSAIFTDPTDVDGWIALQQVIAPDDPSLADPGFTTTALEALETLRPFYQYCAWSRSNDHLALAKVVVEEKKAKRRHSKAPFEENDPVEIVGGLFAGRRGVVQGFDRAGKVKIRVGTLSLPVDAGSLKLLPKP